MFCVGTQENEKAVAYNLLKFDRRSSTDEDAYIIMKSDDTEAGEIEEPTEMLKAQGIDTSAGVEVTATTENTFIVIDFQSDDDKRYGFYHAYWHFAYN